MYPDLDAESIRHTAGCKDRAIGTTGYAVSLGLRYDRVVVYTAYECHCATCFEICGNLIESEFSRVRILTLKHVTQ